MAACSWRFRSLLRTKRFFRDSELVGLFKAHILSFVEYRTAGIYHAASSTLASLDKVLSSFLRKVNVSDKDALFVFKLAPLNSRRDMSMLGVIHKVLLGEGPPQLRSFIRLDSRDLRRSSRQARHILQFVCDLGDRPWTFISY